MEFWQDILVAIFAVIGAIFGLIGSFGLLKLKEPMSRLHAPTKATTLGVGGVLVASMIAALIDRGVLSTHELLITIFLFLTAPVTAHFIAKTHLHQSVRRGDLPPTGMGTPWAGETDQGGIDRLKRSG